MIIVLATTTLNAGEVKNQYQYSLPKIELRHEPYEQIDKIEVFVKCGSIAAVNKIPYDWSVQVNNPVSGDTTMSMEAGHASNSVTNSGIFDNFVTISKPLDSCFDIIVSVRIFWENEERTIRFKKEDLKF